MYMQSSPQALSAQPPPPPPIPMPSTCIFLRRGDQNDWCGDTNFTQTTPTHYPLNYSRGEPCHVCKYIYSRGQVYVLWVWVWRIHGILLQRVKWTRISKWNVNNQLSVQIAVEYMLMFTIPYHGTSLQWTHWRQWKWVSYLLHSTCTWS